MSTELNYRIKAYTRDMEESLENDNVYRRYERVTASTLDTGYYVILGRRAADEYGLLKRGNIDSNGSQSFAVSRSTLPDYIDLYGNYTMWYVKRINSSEITINAARALDNGAFTSLAMDNSGRLDYGKHENNYATIWNYKKSGNFFWLRNSRTLMSLGPETTSYSGKWRGTWTSNMYNSAGFNLAFYKLVDSYPIMTETNRGTVTAGHGLTGHRVGYPGEDVTVIVTLNGTTKTENYTVALTITDLSTGAEIVPTSESQYTYSYYYHFTMPTSGVKISARITEIYTYELFCGQIQHGKLIISTPRGQITSSANSTSSMEVREGETVTIQVFPDTGYVLDKLSVEWLFESFPTRPVLRDDGTYTFTMRENIGTVKATFTLARPGKIKPRPGIIIIPPVIVKP